MYKCERRLPDSIDSQSFMNWLAWTSNSADFKPERHQDHQKLYSSKSCDAPEAKQKVYGIIADELELIGPIPNFREVNLYVFERWKIVKGDKAEHYLVYFEEIGRQINVCERGVS